MLPSSRRSKRKSFLAAPIVLTAMITPACSGRVYTNPGPPQIPPTTATTETPPPDGSAIPTAEPVDTAAPVATTAPSGSASAEVADLPPVPAGDGKLRREPDGSCLYIYPVPHINCPPTAHCNPGPPRKPLKVKCPEGNGP